MMHEDQRDYFRRRVEAELTLARSAGSAAAEAAHRALADAYSERLNSSDRLTDVPGVAPV